MGRHTKSLFKCEIRHCAFCDRIVFECTIFLNVNIHVSGHVYLPASVYYVYVIYNL